MLLHDMAAGYYDAAALIQSKITELRAQEQTPEVRLRISRLKELKKEVRRTGVLCEHYYERGFYIGEFGKVIDKGKRARRRPAKLSEEYRRYERRSHREAEEALDHGHPRGADATAATDIANALLFWPIES